MRSQLAEIINLIYCVYRCVCAQMGNIVFKVALVILY